MAQLTWNQVQAPNMKDANMLMTDAMNRQAIGGVMIAKSLDDVAKDIQDRRDAEYFNQMNQYANDPLGMAQALQNGTINQNGVSQSALQKGREYLSSAATNWSSNISTAHTDMLNQQKQKYAYEVEAYKQALANGELGRADAIIKSVTSKDPTVSAEIFNGNLSFDKTKADAMMMQARAAMAGLANEERKRMSYDRYIEFMDKYYRTAGSDPSVKFLDFINTLSPSEKTYFMDAVKAGNPVWDDLIKGSIAQTAMGEATKASTDTGAPYTGGELHFG